MKYDFHGWATKNDILCSDGVIIRHGAFSSDDGKTVPLVWQHNTMSPDNILGHGELEQRPEGMYVYGRFNDTESAKTVKQLVQHGDIKALSIGARKIKRNGENVVSGSIYEVSLVSVGANEGATIEATLRHYDSDEGDDIILHTGMEVKFEEENKTMDFEEVLNSLSDEQAEAVGTLIEAIQDSYNNHEEDGDEEVKHNVFYGKDNNDTLQHGLDLDLNAVLQAAKDNQTTLQTELKHSMDKLGSPGTYGITNIEMLFPEAKNLDSNGPKFWKDENTQSSKILNGVKKVPFMRIKNVWADLTEKEARARGYITGEVKYEQVFDLYTRETNGQTIYKKQRLDRDHIIDITDFNVVPYIQSEMRSMLEEEIARAILVGDGRENKDPDKVRQDKIRPIIGDHAFFTIQKKFNSGTAKSIEGIFEDVINAMTEYKGSGSPSMFIDPRIVGKMRLLKDKDGRWLFGNRPASLSELADVMGIKEIVPTSFMAGKGFVIVNLSDYTVGTNKGGEITNFSDFDIDFNQYKYLIETRLSGALTTPMSAIYFKDEGGDSTPLTPGLKDFFNAGGKGLKNDLDIQVDVDRGKNERKQTIPGG